MGVVKLLCGKCDHVIQQTWKYCPHCGNYIYLKKNRKVGVTSETRGRKLGSKNSPRD